jgi:hypothetical protein
MIEIWGLDGWDGKVNRDDLRAFSSGGGLSRANVIGGRWKQLFGNEFGEVSSGK